MKLTQKGLNTFILFGTGILYLVFTYFLMIFAASDIYAGQEGAESNIYVHLTRIGIIALSVFALILNKSVVSKTKLYLLVTLWCVWMFLSGLVQPDRYLINLSFTLLWPSVFFLFVLFRKSQIKEIYVSGLFVIIFLLACFLYMTVMQARNVQLLDTLASVNHIYYVILFLPWLLSLKNSLLRNILLAAVILMVVFSAKRGAMLAVLISTAIYLYYTYIKGSGKGMSVSGIMLAIVLAIGAAYGFIIINESSDGYLIGRFESIEDDQGSGRLEIYEEVLSMFSKSSIEYKLMGHGHNMVKPLNKLDLSSHNDYLEALFNYGVIGLILLLMILREMFIRARRLYKLKSSSFTHYVSAIVIFVFMTMVSHIILYPTYIIFLMSYFGYMEPVIGNEINKKR